MTDEVAPDPPPAFLAATEERAPVRVPGLAQHELDDDDAHHLLLGARRDIIRYGPLSLAGFALVSFGGLALFEAPAIILSIPVVAFVGAGATFLLTMRRSLRRRLTLCGVPLEAERLFDRVDVGMHVLPYPRMAPHLQATVRRAIREGRFRRRGADPLMLRSIFEPAPSLKTLWEEQLVAELADGDSGAEPVAALVAAAADGDLDSASARDTLEQVPEPATAEPPHASALSRRKP